MSAKPDLTTLSIPRARKGDAAPVAEAAERAPSPRAAPASGSPPAPAVGPPVEPRTTVSTRLTVAMQERLRRFAFDARKTKQDIIDEALDAHLKAHGF